VSSHQVDDFGLPPGARQEYLQGARDQLGGTAELAERPVAAGDDQEATKALGTAPHGFRGSAGAFGFPQSSIVAP